MIARKVLRFDADRQVLNFLRDRKPKPPAGGRLVIPAAPAVADRLPGPAPVKRFRVAIEFAITAICASCRTTTSCTFWARALVRAGWPLAYSHGFKPSAAPYGAVAAQPRDRVAVPGGP